MLSRVLDKFAFWLVFSVVVLLPVFFVPFSKIPPEISKSLLIVVGLSLAILAWSAARFSDGKVILPRSMVLGAGFLLVLSTLLSSSFSSNQSASFFGAMLDVGTFWFVFSAVLLMILGAILVRTEKKAKFILEVTIISLLALFVFQAVRYFAPSWFSVGVLTNKTATLVGSFTGFGFIAGLSAVLSLFALEFLSLSKKFKVLVYSLLAFSVFHIIAVNSSLIWKISGILALVIFIYRILDNQHLRYPSQRYFPALTFAFVALSLLFFLSGRFVGEILPKALGVMYTEVSPSSTTTFEVGKNAILSNPVFGIGPNRFSEAWSLWKPLHINNSQFWDTQFGSGFGFLSTSALNMGALGIFSWVFFLFSVLYVGFRFLITKPKEPVSLFFYFGALFLFTSSVFYSFGTVPIVLGFLFLGIFVGQTSNSSKDLNFDFLTDPRRSFFAILSLVLIMVFVVGLCFKFIERFASVHYFNQAVLSQDINQAESLINRAINLHQNDLYYRTYAQIHLANLAFLSQKSDLTAEEKSIIQISFDNAVNGSVGAIRYDSNNYLNHQMLGIVYSTVARLGVDGASEKSIEAYSVASKFNPLNPGLKLAIANEYLALGKNKQALDFAEEALSLAPNYLDALIFLAKIEQSLGNNTKSIQYLNRALLLSPNNPNLLELEKNFKNSSSVIEKKQETKEEE